MHQNQHQLASNSCMGSGDGGSGGGSRSSSGGGSRDSTAAKQRKATASAQDNSISANTVACTAAKACLHFVHEHGKRSVPQRLGQILDFDLSVPEDGPAREQIIASSAHACS